MDPVDYLERLRDSLAQAVFPIPPHTGEIGRDRLVRQLDDYLIPRVTSLDAPLLAVVGGSTGAGKSTVVNSLLGRTVSESSAIRPTTRRPLLLHHPDDAAAFESGRVLPGLARVRSHGPISEGDGGIALVAVPELPPGLAIVDAPDIDSVVDANRALADQLLQAADLWLFATTAARYADAVPWDFLGRAAARKAVVALVLNRVPADVRVEVEIDFSRRLADAHLGSSPVFTIEERTLTDGLLPTSAVAPIHDWLHSLAADAASRSRVAKQTLTGAVDVALEQCAAVSVHAESQVMAVDYLAGFTAAAQREATARVREASEDGTLLRGEVLARWQEFVGTGDILRSLESGVGRIRDRIGAFVRGKPSQVHEIEDVIEEGLLSLLVSEAFRARSQIDRSWRAAPGGPEQLAASSLASDAELREAASVHVVEWQGDLLAMIRREGADRRFTARALSFGVNGLAVTLMVILFASTGGITGGEVATAAGAAVVGQKLLEAVFGEDAVRRMTKLSRETLTGHADSLFATYLAPYNERLDALGADASVSEAITQSAADCRAAVALMRAREW